MATIRTNDLYFEYNCKNISFSPKKNEKGEEKDYYKVSDNQPYDDETNEKLIVKMNSAGNNKWKLTIKAGRHKTEDVATWFGEKISSDENERGNRCIAHKTSDKFPKELNFAIIGNLTIEEETEDKKSTKEIVIEDVVIAQGHSSKGENNWWIGGPKAWKTLEKGDFKTLGFLVNNNCGDHLVMFYTSESNEFKIGRFTF